MAELRRAALIVLVVSGHAQVVARDGGRTTSLSLSQPGEPGSLRISNVGPDAVTVERSIIVEYSSGGGWRPLRTEFNVVSTCSRRAPDAAVVISRAVSLNLVPWRGYSCSGQCQGACRANIYFGPGPFRFVLTVLPDRHRVAGPPFTMPARPPGVAGGRTAGASFRLKQPQPR